jgi:glycosyltransferase involved in cell wall biosynthesis
VAGFAPVALENSGARLLIVGSGPELDKLKAQVKGLGVAGQCVFVPATEQVAEWLRAMDIFVLPSLSEAFSNSLMEAMACGCCVVASNVGGNPELAGDPRRGVLFEARDSAALTGVLRDLVGNPERRKRMANEGSSFIRNGFTMAGSARRMAEIYALNLQARGNL